MRQQPVIGYQTLDGTIHEGNPPSVFAAKHRNAFHTGGWYAMSQPQSAILAKAKLGGEALTVFMYINSKLELNNRVVINQTEFARDLEMSQPNFARALKKLLTEGVYVALGKEGRNAVYGLNPHYGWKGDAQEHHKAKDRHSKQNNLRLIKGSLSITL